MSLRLNQGYLKVPVNIQNDYTIRFFRLPWDSPYWDEVVILSNENCYVNGGLNNSYDISFVTVKNGYVYISHEVGEIEQLLILHELVNEKTIADWHTALVYFYADEKIISQPAPFNVVMEVS